MRTRLAGVLIAVVLLASVQACTAPPQPPTESDAAMALTRPAIAPASLATPDYDRDGKADLAVDLNLDPNGLALGARVWYGNDTVRDLGESDFGSGNSGGPLLARDLNGDAFTDLVMTWRSDARRTVEVIYGSATGLKPSSRATVLVATDTDDGQSTVTALALVDLPRPRLAVGVFSTLGGAVKPGKVLLYDLDSAGQPAGHVVLRPGQGKVPSLSDAGSFGRALAASGNQLFIGAPDAKVNSHRTAGALGAITFSASGVSRASFVTQSTPGVVGAVGRDDEFGRSLAARNGFLVVGTPGDAVGSVKNTGSVQVFRLARGLLTPSARISQSTSGVPGRAESGDRFGFAVDIGVICAGVPSLVVGGPGEVITRGHESDGAVWIAPVSSDKKCPARQLYEGSGLGTKHAGENDLGGFVAALRSAGSAVDDLVLSGMGVESSHASRMYRWAPSTTTATTVEERNFFVGVAGR